MPPIDVRPWRAEAWQPQNIAKRAVAATRARKSRLRTENHASEPRRIPRNFCSSSARPNKGGDVFLVSKAEQPLNLMQTSAAGFLRWLRHLARHHLIEQPVPDEKMRRRQEMNFGIDDIEPPNYRRASWSPRPVMATSAPVTLRSFFSCAASPSGEGTIAIGSRFYGQLARVHLYLFSARAGQAQCCSPSAVRGRLDLALGTRHADLRKKRWSFTCTARLQNRQSYPDNYSTSAQKR